MWDASISPEKTKQLQPDWPNFFFKRHLVLRDTNNDLLNCWWCCCERLDDAFVQSAKAPNTLLKIKRSRTVVFAFRMKTLTSISNLKIRFYMRIIITKKILIQRGKGLCALSTAVRWQNKGPNKSHFTSRLSLGDREIMRRSKEVKKIIILCQHLERWPSFQMWMRKEIKRILSTLFM